MRHGRSKAARKTLHFFARTQGFKPPYHILLDGTFLVAIVKYNFPLRERLEKLLQHASFTLYTTSSCINELAKLQQANQDQEKAELLQTTLQWAKKECTRLEQVPDFEQSTKDRLNKSYPDWEQAFSQPGLDMLKLALHHQHHHKYFVACQDETVLDALRQSGSVPCIRLARGSVLLLENPSKSGQLQDSHAEKKKWTGGTIREEERKLVAIAKEESKRQKKQQPAPTMDRHHHHHQQQQVRKKRKAKEPNPLSCKKSKSSSEEMDESSKKKRRRRNKTTTPSGTITTEA